jgi:hypothetical protein
MKLRTIIVTTCGVLAVAVPAAQAATTNNSRLYQTKIHTVLAEKHTQAAKASQARLAYYEAVNRFYAKQIAAARQALVDKNKRLDGDPGWKD